MSPVAILTFLRVVHLTSGVGSVTAQHLLILADPDTLTLDDLQVLETAQNFVVDLEGNLDVELGALLNLERLILEAVDRARGGQVDDNIFTAVDLQSQRLDDTLARVVGVGDGLAGVEAQRGLPAVQRLIVLV